ncbi:MAG: Ribosomal silencing factor RsfS [Thermotoga sp. 50_1627]|uniref:ribosome silencing factor n=1 Tax=Pseudothermotoga sp. TaxID=2033661 RepID=UPI00076D46D8|nr:MAG: Ribosomal silencing factor RsfS [Thermotoga sp. 50_64]KUK24915.1 MAG: Ribosomal silencing factor RsfS [Thermotoga sp. 50_1627]MBC7116243.1 ribosome silencing factor [Pseudothermotoga sp.]MDK2923316.1 ribosome-associated protein [Pseudothermotoga sp.]HBT38732.1 ribosome silencing factor [Pseudothermotoga sp.]
MDLLRRLFDLMNEKEAINTVVLDMRKTPMPADFFVIATANSQTHMGTLRNAVVEFFLSNGHSLIYYDKGEGYDWLLIDAGDIVVHIFTTRGREFYDLEGLWSDAVKLFQA